MYIISTRNCGISASIIVVSGVDLVANMSTFKAHHRAATMGAVGFFLFHLSLFDIDDMPAADSPSLQYS